MQKIVTHQARCRVSTRRAEQRVRLFATCCRPIYSDRRVGPPTTKMLWNSDGQLSFSL